MAMCSVRAVHSRFCDLVMLLKFPGHDVDPSRHFTSLSVSLAVTHLFLHPLLAVSSPVSFFFCSTAFIIYFIHLVFISHRASAISGEHSLVLIPRGEGRS